ncbi:MAG: hypothetical protein HZA02_05945 [Nitrospinae bacterium]|nr:hypothetical protein [Nitrospinota bacterium]
MELEMKMRKPIKAYGGNGLSTIYEFSDKTGEMKNGGTKAWRNTNPGNLISGEFVQNHGGIGNNRGFGVFPDFATGRGAMYDLLQLPKYHDVTLAEAIYIYAPPKYNDTEAYIRRVVELTGFHRTDRMADLDNWRLVDAMIQHEKYKDGIIKPIKKLSEVYAWRTMRDKKVRPEHAKREGVVFRWDKPDFDHPGEARGCRCWAEAHEYEYVAKATNPFEVQIYIGC